MKRGRIYFNGSIQDITGQEGKVRLADGRLLDETEVNWLPPVEPGTIFALGLNYADHAAELDFKAPENPLVFLKGKNSVTGHRSFTRRPDDATYMHYECELAVIIGRAGKHISTADAYDHIAGYSVANDYAIRDYLENYYRPNLPVKNRDGCTPLGPWLVDAGDIDNPMSLTLKTFVNGRLTQEGTTADMIFDIPALIAWLSEFMTLNPGDIILTGTPQGLADVRAGDEVVTEIEQVGRLVNTIVSDKTFFSLSYKQTR